MPVQIATADDEFGQALALARAACGRLALTMHQPVMAVEQLSRALELLPDDAALLVELARAVGAERGGDDLSCGAAAQLDVLVPAVRGRGVDHPRVWAQLADAYYQLQRPEDALRAVSHAASPHSGAESPNVWALQARILLLAMDSDPKMRLDQLVPYFVHAVELAVAADDRSCEIETRVSLAQLYHRFACYRESHAELVLVLQLVETATGSPSATPGAQPISAPPVTSVSQTHPLKRALPEQLAKLAYVYQFLCVVHFKMGLGAAAKKLCLDALQVLPPCSLTFRLLAVLAIFYITDEDSVQLRNLVPALLAERSVMCESQSTSRYVVNWLLGCIFDLLNDSAQSYQCYQLAMDVRPMSPPLWIAIGSLYLRVGQPADAQIAFSRAVTHASEEDTRKRPFLMRFNRLFAAFAYVGLSQAQLALHQRPAALEHLHHAITLFTAEKNMVHARQAEQMYARLADPRSNVLDYIIPDIPTDIFLELYLYWDSPVFTSTPSPYDVHEPSTVTDNSKPDKFAAKVESSPVYLPQRSASQIPITQLPTAQVSTAPLPTAPASFSKFPPAPLIKTPAPSYMVSPGPAVPAALSAPSRYCYSQPSIPPQPITHQIQAFHSSITASPPMVSTGMHTYAPMALRNFPVANPSLPLNSRISPQVAIHTGPVIMSHAAAYHPEDTSR